MNRTAIPLLLSILLIGLAGCDNLTENGTATSSTTASTSKLDIGTGHIRTCLDSWEFGDDDKTFEADHPLLEFSVLDDIMRRQILTKYELGSHRPYAVDLEVGKATGFEFSAKLYFSTNGGTEALVPYKVRVFPIPTTDGEWAVVAEKK